MFSALLLFFSSFSYTKVLGLNISFYRLFSFFIVGFSLLVIFALKKQQLFELVKSRDVLVFIFFLVSLFTISSHSFSSSLFFYIHIFLLYILSRLFSQVKLSQEMLNGTFIGLSCIELGFLVFSFLMPNFTLNIVKALFIEDVVGWLRYDLQRGRIFSLFGLFFFQPFLLQTFGKGVTIRKINVVGGALFLAILFGSFFTGYRQIMISTLASSFLSLVIFKEQTQLKLVAFLRKMKTVQIQLLVVLLLITMSVLSGFALFNKQSSVARLASSFTSNSGETFIRFYLWEQGLSIFQKNILSGVGLDSINLYMNNDEFFDFDSENQVFILSNRTKVLNHSHSFVLNFFAEVGSVSGVLFFVWLLYDASLFFTIDPKKITSFHLLTVVVVICFLVDNLFTIPTLVPLQILAVIKGVNIGLMHKRLGKI